MQLSSICDDELVDIFGPLQTQSTVQPEIDHGVRGAII